MIEYKRGNLLKENVQAQVNTVNCVGVMGKGIALQFKQAFPAMFSKYKQACDDEQVTVGKMNVVETSSMFFPKYIINFPTKKHWKNKSELAYIKEGLVDLVRIINELNIESVAIPPLGCGLGGLKWEDVKDEIESALSGFPDVKIVVFEPAKTPSASDMKKPATRKKMTRARAMYLLLIDKYLLPGYKLSLLEMQKLAYFLQEAGEPLRLRFVAHKYGPYANNLHHVLQAMEGHYIEGYGDRSVSTPIFLKPNAVDEAAGFLKDLSPANELLEKVSRLIKGFETPYGLELLATAHWIISYNDSGLVDADMVIAGFKNWNERKKATFKEGHIRKAVERLVGEKWVIVL